MKYYLQYLMHIQRMWDCGSVNVAPWSIHPHLKEMILFIVCGSVPNGLIWLQVKDVRLFIICGSINNVESGNIIPHLKDVRAFIVCGSVNVALLLISPQVKDVKLFIICCSVTVELFVV